MRIGGTAPLRQADDGPGRFTIDVTIPYADAERNRALRAEWRRQGGELVPTPRLTLPQRLDGFYAAHIRQKKIVDHVIQEICTNQVVGQCRYADLIKTCFPLGGDARFTVAQETFNTGTGLICAGRNGAAWNWEVGSTAQMMVLLLPARDVCFPKGKQTIMAEQKMPAARLLLAHIQSWAGLCDELSPAASRAVHNATLELFHGLLNDKIVDDEQFSPALVRAAMEWMNTRLLDDPDLSPQTVAASLHVSVRTLHRAFANEAVSVMGYVREQRLKRARIELTATSLSVSEIAARWHFADISHFIKAYKKQFGQLPGDLRRSRQTHHLPPGSSRTGKIRW